MTAEEQLAELQATFDEFVVSSKEVEASLAQELEDESAALSKAKGRIREVRDNAYLLAFDHVFAP